MTRFRRKNVVEFAANAQPVWLQLDSFFAAHVDERRKLRKRLPEHLSLGSMLRSNSPAASALVMPSGHVQRWLDAVGTRLSAADVGAILAKQPEVICSAPDKAVASVAWVTNTFPEVPLSKIIGGAPWLLQLETSTLQRKLDNIAAAVGVTDSQAKQLALKMPTLLTSSSASAVQDAVAWLRQFHPTTDELFGLLLRGPTLLGASTDRLQRNADFLQAPPFGFDKERLAAYIRRFPQGFGNGDFRSDKTEPKLLFLSEVVGVSRVEVIEQHSNYLKYGLPTMTASFVLLRDHAPHQLVYEDGGVSLVFAQGKADDFANFCSMAVEEVRHHMREWPRCDPGRSLLDELRQGSVAGWLPYLKQLDEKARLRRQAGGQLGSSGAAAGGKRRRKRRQQPNPLAGSGRQEQ